MEKTIEERAQAYTKEKDVFNNAFYFGYIAGANEQQRIDIEKACSAYCECCETQDCIEENVPKEECYFRLMFCKAMEE